jgi:hypothetical protein
MFENGKLVSYTNKTDASGATFDFVDGDVTVGTDSVNETAHGYETGDIVQLTSTGTLPAGLSLATDYYIIRVDADNVKFAASLSDAEAGTPVTITAAAGGGTHTSTQQEREHNAMDVNIVNEDLNVSITTAMGLGIYAEDSAHTSGDDGQQALAVRQDSLASSTSTDGDYGSFKQNAKGELYVIDTDGNALLTTIDADTSNIAVDTAAMVVDLAAIEVELLDQGTTLDSILTDTNAMVVDLAAIEVELLDQGTTLDGIKTDTATIAGDTTSIDATLTALSKAEDSAHGSGDQGIMGLAVRNDTEGSLVDTDGDYAPLQVDSSGRLRVTTSVDIDDDLADTAIANTATSVSAVAIDIKGTSLADRKWLFLSNESNKSLYWGTPGVSAANGFPLHPGMQVVARIGPSVIPEVIGEATASGEDLRVMELS